MSSAGNFYIACRAHASIYIVYCFSGSFFLRSFALKNPFVSSVCTLVDFLFVCLFVFFCLFVLLLLLLLFFVVVFFVVVLLFFYCGLLSSSRVHSDFKWKVPSI